MYNMLAMPYLLTYYIGVLYSMTANGKEKVDEMDVCKNRPCMLSILLTRRAHFYVEIMCN